MLAVPSGNASAGRIGSRGRAGIAALLLAGSVADAAGSLSAAPATELVCQDQDASCSDGLPLDRLSVKIDGLKASLSALRQDLETRRGETQPPAPAIAELCASERGAARDAAAASSDELAAMRERLAVAAAEVAQLRDERAQLISRVDELDAAVEKARTSEVAPALVEPRRGAPVDPAQAAAFKSVPERRLMLPVAAQPGPALIEPERHPASAGGKHPGPPVDRLQLQAELALAQLEIADLTAALQSARLQQEQAEAEVSTLRLLTDAKIKQLMGWQ